jgi:hypothetical protein
MPVTVGADVPEDSLSSAAFGLGLNREKVSRSGVIRAALALFHGNDKDTAREYATPKNQTQLGSNGQTFVTAQVPEDLADTGDTPRAYAIRVGLALAAGLSRKEAENWAKMVVNKVGRPAKKLAS